MERKHGPIPAADRAGARIGGFGSPRGAGRDRRFGGPHQQPRRAAAQRTDEEVVDAVLRHLGRRRRR